MGKGMTPKKGYNQKLYEDNYDDIFRKKPVKKVAVKKKAK